MRGRRRPVAGREMVSRLVLLLPLIFEAYVWRVHGVPCDLSAGSCCIWEWSETSKEDILKAQVSSASSLNLTIYSADILFLFLFLCLLPFFLP
jgi:hypothetical protein